MNSTTSHRRVTPRARHSFRMSLGGVALAVLAPAALAGTIPDGVPVSAVAADPPLVMPTTNASGFENLSPVTPFPPPTPPYTKWGPWRAFHPSGVADSGDPILNGLLPDAGTSSGYVTGDGYLRCKYRFDPGIWRLSYRAAARSTGGIPEGQRVRISIAGTVLAEHEYDGSFASYTTRPIQINSAALLNVVFRGLDPTGNGDTTFLDEIRLERISDWQDSATWTPGKPNASHPVTIPDDARVALVGSCDALNVTLEGELLAPNASSTLGAKWVRVTGSDARLQVGTEDVPFQEEFTLTLKGTVSDPGQTGGGTKFLVAEEGGVIDMHGAPRLSWTKLAATVDSNTSPPELTLVDTVDWEAGDWLVVAGSENQPVNPQFTPYGGDWTDYAEKVQIAAVDTVTNTVELTQSLAHLHYGAAPKTYTSGARTWELDQRAEVGLLSHNIKVQGDGSSDLFQPSTGNGWVGFGGHIMIRRTPTGHGLGRFSNVELYRMGQSKEGASGGLGRYPMHWHMNLDAGEGQYLRNSSIHHTYNRAVVVHGTEHVAVENNVAYDNLGHAIFLEDGSERFNHINYNLVLSTQIPDPANAILDTDHIGHSFQNQSPSSFWITNPNNEMIGNVCAGTVGTGFWFAFPDSPAGLSATEPYFTQQQIVPNREPLDEFTDNVCHGARSGFDVNDGFDVNHVLRTNVDWLPPSTAYLDDYTVYCSATGLYAGTASGDLVFRNNVLADNRKAVTFAAYHTVEDSVIVADSLTGLFSFPVNACCPQAQAFSIYDGAATLKSCHMVGYNVTGTSLLHNRGGENRHVNNRFEDLTFEPAVPPIMHLPNFPFAQSNCSNGQDLGDPRKWMMSIVDVDGSVTGTPGTSIIGNHPMMRRTLATGAQFTMLVPEDVLWSPGQNTWLSPFRFGQLRVRHNNQAGNPLLGPTLEQTRDAHPLWATNTFVNCSTSGLAKQFPIVLNRGFEYGTKWVADPPSNTDTIVVRLDDLKNGDDGTVRLEWTVSNQNVQIVGEALYGGLTPPTTISLTSYASLAALQSGTTTGYFFEDSTTLWLRFVSTGERGIELTLSDVLP